METIDRSVLTFFLNALWQAPLAAAVAAMACRMMRNGPARHRHAVCVAALIALLLLPLASVRSGSGGSSTLAVPGPSLGAAQATASHGEITAAAAANAPAQKGIPVPRTAAWLLIGGYVLMVTLRAARFVTQAMHTRRILHDAVPCTSTAVWRIWNRCAAAMGVEAALRCSVKVAGPVTAGRTIILPASMLAGAPDGILTTAIGHEMAHIARRDFTCNLLYEAAALPVWFHPATLWLRREIDRTRELACDELVTGKLLEPGAYAESIVSIAAEMSGLRRPGYTLGVLDGDILEDRIQRLLHRPVSNLKRARLMLAAGLGALAVCVVAASSLAISARAQSAAQPEMKLAGQAYNTGDFAGAVSHFEKAVSLDPGNTNARLFLANAYVRQYRANSRAEGAAELLNKAREQYREAATRDPRNVPAMYRPASMLGMDHAQEARQWMLKAIEADPKNENAYYTAGVADWQMAYALLRDSGNLPGPAMYDQIADPAARARLEAQMLPIIEDGFRMLQIALNLDPQSSDAMAYMNLLVRLKAPLVNTAAEHSKVIAQADDWVRKALEARKARGADTAGQIDVDQPAPQAIPAMVPAPPPPPPPPPGGFRGNGDRAQ